MRTTIFLTAILTVSGLMACEVAQPFNNYNFEGELADDQEVVIGATQLGLGEQEGAKELFDDYLVRIDDALESQPGFIGASFRTEIGGNNRYTLTAWESQEAMMDFVLSEVHLDAIDDFFNLSSAGRTTSYTIRADVLPPKWDRALEELSLADEYE